MSTNSNTSGGGIGFGGLLAILFIGLKLTGYVDWSWAWVLSPIWIPLALFAVVLAVAAVVYMVAAVVGARR
jgi:hypothetical protein